MLPPSVVKTTETELALSLLWSATAFEGEANEALNTVVGLCAGDQFAPSSEVVYTSPESVVTTRLPAPLGLILVAVP